MAHSSIPFIPLRCGCGCTWRLKWELGPNSLWCYELVCKIQWHSLCEPTCCLDETFFQTGWRGVAPNSVVAGHPCVVGNMGAVGCFSELSCWYLKQTGSFLLIQLLFFLLWRGLLLLSALLRQTSSIPALTPQVLGFWPCAGRQLEGLWREEGKI